MQRTIVLLLLLTTVSLSGCSSHQPNPYVTPGFSPYTHTISPGNHAYLPSCQWHRTEPVVVARPQPSSLPKCGWYQPSSDLYEGAAHSIEVPSEELVVHVHAETVPEHNSQITQAQPNSFSATPLERAPVAENSALPRAVQPPVQTLPIIQNDGQAKNTAALQNNVPARSDPSPAIMPLPSNNLLPQNRPVLQSAPPPVRPTFPAHEATVRRQEVKLTPPAVVPSRSGSHDWLASRPRIVRGSLINR